MSFREQLEIVARLMPIWLVLFGGIGGVLIAASNIISISQTVPEVGAGLNLVWSFVALFCGLRLTVTSAISGRSRPN